jgi:hypothetical protein
MAGRLQGETGASPTEMRSEMVRMMTTLGPLVDQMDDYEQRFVTSMMDNLTSDSWTPTPKQLFKARDINEKY